MTWTHLSVKDVIKTSLIKVIWYWPRYRSEVNCIGLRLGIESVTAIGPIRNYLNLINNIG